MIPMMTLDDLNGHVRYPLPPTMFHRFADGMDVYVRFMRHLRVSHHARASVNILLAMEAVVASTDHDALSTAMILVDLGLRAPRAAFPAVFLDLVDGASGRDMSPAILGLMQHWQIMDDPANTLIEQGKSPHFPVVEITPDDLLHPLV